MSWLVSWLDVILDELCSVPNPDVVIDALVTAMELVGGGVLSLVEEEGDEAPSSIDD